MGVMVMLRSRNLPPSDSISPVIVGEPKRMLATPFWFLATLKLRLVVSSNLVNATPVKVLRLALSGL